MTVRVWDVKRGQEVIRRERQPDKVHGLCISEDKQHLLVGSNDKVVRLLDLKTMREIRQFHGHGKMVFSVAISPDGRHGISSSCDPPSGSGGTVRLWNLETGRQIQEFAGPASAGMSALTFSKDGRYILSACHNGLIQLRAVGSVAQDIGSTANPRTSGIGRREIAVPRDIQKRTTDLLTLLDLSQGVNKGRCEMQGSTLIGYAVGTDVNVTIPYELPDEYTLQISATPQDNDDINGLAAYLTSGDTQFIVELSKNGSCFLPVDGKDPRSNGTARIGPVFNRGQTNKIVYEVTKDRITATVNDNKILDWAEFHRLGQRKPGTNGVGLGLWGSLWLVQEIVIYPR